MTAHDRLEALARERIVLVPYDPAWPVRYAEIEMVLQRALPPDSWTRIAHIGSTAIPGLRAKPIIDVQVEVTSLDRVRREVVPIMTDLGYTYIWRPTMGERAPFYAWFVARDAQGARVAHVHMVEPDEASADRLLFRDFLRAHPVDARRYELRKEELLASFADDREAYTRGKSDLIHDILHKARHEWT